MSILLTPRAESMRRGLPSSLGRRIYLSPTPGRLRPGGIFSLKWSHRILQERPVAFLVPPGFHYVAVQWGIWRAGGIAVPLVPVPSTGRNWNTSLTTRSPRSVVAHPDFAIGLAPLAEDARPALRPDHRGPGASPGSAARRGAGAAGDDPLHERHHRQAQGRGDHAREHRRPDHQPGGGLGMDRRRPHPARAAAASRARHRQRHLVCALWSGATCEILPRFDAGRGLGAHRRTAT